MRQFLVGLCGLSVLLFGGSSAFAQQAAEFVVSVEVFEDSSVDGIRDTDEDQLLGWQVELFDETFTQLDSASSSNSAPVPLQSTTRPWYVCVTPVDFAIQTLPASGTNYPGDVAWFCYVLPQDGIFEEVYEFGVVSEEVEETPELLTEEPTEAIEKETPVEETGDVLGDTDEPDVLAETGSVAAYAPVVGITLYATAFALARHSKVD